MTTTLAGKIAKASADLGNRLKADKKNTQGGGYMYISADKLIAEAGAVLAANGVAVFPSIIGYNVDGGESSGGKRNYIVTVNFMMAVSDGESSMDCPWMGAGVDYGAMDKALYKGITSGHKYFLAKLLNIGEGNEDGEHEAPPPQGERQAQPATNGKPAVTTVTKEADAGDKPAPYTGADVFKVRYPAAKDAARKAGKFTSEKHLNNAWAGIFKEYDAHDPANADVFLAAWEAYVEAHEPEGVSSVADSLEVPV